MCHNKNEIYIISMTTGSFTSHLYYSWPIWKPDCPLGFFGLNISANIYGGTEVTSTIF